MSPEIVHAKLRWFSLSFVFQSEFHAYEETVSMYICLEGMAGVLLESCADGEDGPEAGSWFRQLSLPPKPAVTTGCKLYYLMCQP